MRKIFVAFVLFTLAFYSCTSDEGGSDNNTDYNRKALLEFTADKIIIPALEDLQTKLNTLKTSIATFTENPNQANLEEASTSWLNAYKTWQHVEMFNIGKAEALNEYYFFMNIYPVTKTDVNDAVKSGNYNLNSANYHDAQGFPGIDYLLHSNGALDRFTTDNDAAGYKSYLTAVINQMTTLTEEVFTDWKSSYRDTFVANVENSNTGSLNKLVNDFVFYYEKGFRANKIGIPAGNWSNTPLPNRVEALYKKDVSKTLALEAMTAVENFFNGKAYGKSTTGESLKSYLSALNRDDLVTVINDKFSAARQKINSLNNDFSSQVESDNIKMTEAYDAIQAAVPSLKVDMLQAFDVAIDYVDADGD